MRKLHAAAVIAVCAAAAAVAQVPSGLVVANPPTSNFIGQNQRLPTDDLMTGRRRFEPGAHTAWHIHPGGQLILVEEGVAVVQRRGEPVKVLHKGDVDFTPAGVPHWHGAAPDTFAVKALVHFGGIGPWLEPVTADEYAALTRHLRTGNAAVQGTPPDTRGSTTGQGDSHYVGESSGPASDDMQVARGRFEAGARTNWHIHSKGQVILAEEGPVYVQRRGEAVKVLQTGQADFTPPGVAHWHGAGPDSPATKVVVGFGAPTVWLEPVSDDAYAAATGKSGK